MASVGQEFTQKYHENSLSLLHNGWSLSQQDLSSWGELNSSNGIDGPIAKMALSHTSLAPGLGWVQGYAHLLIGAPAYGLSRKLSFKRE